MGQGRRVAVLLGSEPRDAHLPGASAPCALRLCCRVAPCCSRGQGRRRFHSLLHCTPFLPGLPQRLRPPTLLPALRRGFLRPGLSPWLSPLQHTHSPGDHPSLRRRSAGRRSGEPSQHVLGQQLTPSLPRPELGTRPSLAPPAHPGTQVRARAGGEERVRKRMRRKNLCLLGVATDESTASPPIAQDPGHSRSPPQLPIPVHNQSGLEGVSLSLSMPHSSLESQWAPQNGPQQATPHLARAVPSRPHTGAPSGCAVPQPAGLHLKARPEAAEPLTQILEASAPGGRGLLAKTPHKVGSVIPLPSGFLSRQEGACEQAGAPGDPAGRAGR
ncbi:prostate stem cell antigen isoform X3 [Mustela erminea]|uniref:prostate stem cell antigen isoform X3 n=1 Tax=Mustela erminea TaxID=36723 RepID=UPI001386FE5A|nr:prostate stem cell antigen isoform X3 [Mustela erminea]